MITSEAKPPSWRETDEKYRASAGYYFAAVEWALEWLHYWWSGFAFFKLLELAGRLTILGVVVTWFLEADSREKARRISGLRPIMKKLVGTKPIAVSARENMSSNSAKSSRQASRTLCSS